MLPNQYHWDIAKVLFSKSINSLSPPLSSLFSAVRVPIMGNTYCHLQLRHKIMLCA